MLIWDILDEEPLDLEVVDPFITFPPELKAFIDDVGGHLGHGDKLTASHYA